MATLAAEVLGVGGPVGGRAKIRDLIAKASAARAQHLALVVVLAAIEERTGVHTWRNPGREATYLGALGAWGYSLSPVEQIARGPKPKPAPAPANTKTRAKASNTTPTPKAAVAAKPTTKAATA